jgi:NAD(P)H dehydrogenase (quinone)
LTLRLQDFGQLRRQKAEQRIDAGHVAQTLWCDQPERDLGHRRHIDGHFHELREQTHQLAREQCNAEPCPHSLHLGQMARDRVGGFWRANLREKARVWGVHTWRHVSYPVERRALPLGARNVAALPQHRHGHAEQMLCAEISLFRLEEAQGEVCLAMGEIGGLVSEHEVDADAWIGRAKRSEQTRNQHLGGEGFRGGEANPPRRFDVGLGRGGKAVEEGALHALGVAAERNAEGSGSKSRMASLEKRALELRLQGTYATRDGGLVDADLPGRAREAARAKDCEKETQIVPGEAGDVMHGCMDAMQNIGVHACPHALHTLGMKNVLIIMGHPDKTSFSARCAEAYAKACVDAGASVTQLDLVDLSFDLVLRGGYAREQALEPDLVRARDAIVAAQHVAFVFPLWWNAPPALVKGFVDRLLTPGFAFAYEKGKPLPKRLLTGRSARFITFMDAPAVWYWLRMRSPLHAAFVTGTLEFVGFSPVRTQSFYSMREKSAQAREAALESVRKSAHKDVSALG